MRTSIGVPAIAELHALSVLPSVPSTGISFPLDFHLLFTYPVYIRGARLAYRLTEGSRTAATGRRAAASGNRTGI